MSGLEPGQARMRNPDPGIDDTIVLAAQVPHLEYNGWTYLEGDRETWPEELQRFGGAEQVHIHHPETGGTAIVPRDAAAHWRSRGWVELDPQAEQAAALEDKTVVELRELAKERGISPIPTIKAELIEALEGAQEPTTDQAGDEPADQQEEE
jgi:hypothetical protein